LNNIVSNPPLTWSTTNPEVAAFGTTTNTSGSNSASARNNVGGTTLFASCTPPTCNIGVQPGLPIYASDGPLPNGENGYSQISVSVTSTSTPPTYTAWVATGISDATPDGGCDNAPGCSSAMFSVTPGVNPIGSIVAVPRTPNSMMFNHQSSARLYMGSNQGLMYVDVGSSSPSVSVVANSALPCNISLCGKVLTISNDGKLVVISDTVTSPNQVYIYNGSSTTAAPIDLIIPGQTATAAAFSPDQLKLFILTDTGSMYVYSTVDALTSVPIATTVTDVKFSANGSFAYVAGAPSAHSVSGFATCDAQPTIANASISPNFDSVTTPGVPLKIFPSPDAKHVLALDPPYIDTFSTIVTQLPLPYDQFVCNVPSPGVDIDPRVNFPPAAQSFNLGQGNFTPVEAQLVGNGTEMIIVARHLPAVLMFNVSNGTTTSIPLVGNPDPLSASISTDGSQVYIAACDQYTGNPPACIAGSVHIVNMISQGDLQQVPYVNINQNNNPNMCSGAFGAPLCLPNLIAVKPQ
jgi:hypothetical protein